MPSRPCRYCKGPSFYEEPQYGEEYGEWWTFHYPECDAELGLFPVDEKDLWLGGEFVGMMCPGCRHVFQLGEYYVHANIDGDGSTYVATCVCVGCGALAGT